MGTYTNYPPTAADADDTAYGTGWNGSTLPPTQNAVYDIINYYSIRTLVDSSASISLVFATANAYICNSSVNATWSLPSATASTNLYFYLKNRGSANVTLSAYATNEIYYGEQLDSFVLYPGESCTIICDGTVWNII